MSDLSVCWFKAGHFVRDSCAANVQTKAAAVGQSTGNYWWTSQMWIPDVQNSTWANDLCCDGSINDIIWEDLFVDVNHTAVVFLTKVDYERVSVQVIGY